MDSCLYEFQSNPEFFFVIEITPRAWDSNHVHGAKLIPYHVLLFAMWK